MNRRSSLRAATVLLLLAPFAAAEDPPEFVLKWGGSPGSGDGQFRLPVSVATDADGNVYVADQDNHRIQKFAGDGTFLLKWGSLGTGDGQFHVPLGVAADTVGNVYVSDSENHRIQKFTSDGTFLGKWGAPYSGMTFFPAGIATDPAGNVYVANGEYLVLKFAGDGTFLGVRGSPGHGGVATDAEGNVYVADYYGHRIRKFASSGRLLAEWGYLGSGHGEFTYPRGLATDADGHVYVADDYNRIQKFTGNGNFLLDWGSFGAADGQFRRPVDVAVDAAGNVYVADWGNNRIQKFAKRGLDVTPQQVAFGNVGALWESRTAIVTLTNTSSSRVVMLTEIALSTASSAYFSIASGPADGTALGPGETADVELLFAPDEVGEFAGTLVIGSNDPVRPEIEVAISGTGVEAEIAGPEMIEITLEFFDDCVEAGTIEGDGPGDSADGRLQALHNMIEAAGDLLNDGDIEGAIGQLLAALEKVDGDPKPPDFVTGEDVDRLALLIEDMIEELE